MADIKYTPSELLAQSTEMTSLQNELQALFQQTTSALSGMNDSWSENLARNFSGKIQSAQSSFSSILNMFANGAAAAKLGATSHSATSIESFLESVADTAASPQTSTSAFTDQDKQDLYDMLPESVQKAIDGVQDVDSWLSEKYDSLPDSVKSTIDKYTPSSVKSIVSVAHDIASGETDASTVGNAVTAVTGDPLLGNVTTAAYEAATASYRDDFDQAFNEDCYKAGDCFRSGDIGDGVLYTAAAFGEETRALCVGVADGFTNIIGSTLESVDNSVVSEIGSAIHNWLK